MVDATAIRLTSAAQAPGTHAEHPSAEKPISVGASLTLRAAERHAARANAEAVAPSHVLVALLERPDPVVKAYLAEKGA